MASNYDLLVDLYEVDFKKKKSAVIKLLEYFLLIVIK